MPTNAYLTRSGGQWVIKCNHTDESWIGHCDGKDWIGHVGNCPGNFLKKSVKIACMNGQTMTSGTPYVYIAKTNTIHLSHRQTSYHVYSTLLRTM